MSCSCNNSGCSGSPCQADSTSTAACETIASQIENFTAAFFGSVVKTEVDGDVTWELPCDLGIGLPNNPRADGEGLACYFLRLFNEGILGLTGPAGATGSAGTNGNNAYTVTVLGFGQPSEGAPSVQVKTLYNPAILAGTYIFIQSSGWYVVNSIDSTSGVLFLTLVRALSGAPATITAGKLVVLSGFPGASVTGPAGPTGATGPTGAAGTTFFMRR